MKVNILSKIVDTPSGGGNQFLKALQGYLINSGCYEKDPYKADIILFNSFNFIEDGMFFELLNLKRLGKVLVHRVDGPISLYRGRDIELDKLIYDINNKVADATIFQSDWSREANYNLGMRAKKFEAVIMNAPDGKLFNRDGKIEFSKNRKIRLIATSWSSNINKGFDVYKWLDQNLNFNKYEMTFVGNSPVIFDNINKLEPKSSIDLSKLLKESDIYITASKKDPCSNSLIEALHTGLPAVVLKDGGHPEILSTAGGVFDSQEQIPDLLDDIVDNYELYQKNISNQTMEDIGNLYIQFFQKLNFIEKRERYYGIGDIFLLLQFYLWKIKRKFK